MDPTHPTQDYASAPLEVLDLIAEQVGIADGRYGAFTSTHEGLGVLIEEVEELREAIRANRIDRVREEAIQVAAVAWRLAEACELAAFRNRSRGVPGK